MFLKNPSAEEKEGFNSYQEFKKLYQTIKKLCVHSKITIQNVFKQL
jgi:hypothetical protein